jgi:hypothetical protein
MYNNSRSDIAILGRLGQQARGASPVRCYAAHDAVTVGALSSRSGVHGVQQTGSTR